MPTIPYVKAGAPFADTTASSGTFNATKANTIDTGVYESMLQPAVSVYHNAGQSITSGVVTALAFNSERFDQAGGSADTQHDTVTNNSRLTCKYAGVYLIVGNVEWSADPVNGTCRIRHQGSTTIAWAQSAAGNPLGMVVCRLYALAVNEYVELVVSQSSGTNKTINSTANYSPEFSMVRVA